MLKLSLLAKAISVIFLPPLVSLWFFIIFAFYSPVGLSTSPLYMAGVGITFFTILPLLTLVLLARGHGPTFAVPQSSRHLSYVIVFFEYIIGTLIFYLGKAIILFVIGIIYIAIIVALMIINLFWKISVHAAGISGPATFCIYIFGPVTIWAFPLIMFVLLVLWARWRLQAHTVSQLVGGTMVASIITLLISYISF
ncbi:MAG: hypothetical protein ACFFCD_02455 [Promethearchaeota archaeon]